ncbi:MAG: peptidylprolyl isomerase [Clostridiales bacterium]
MKNSKRIVSVLCIAAMALSLLTACGSGAAGSQEPQGQVPAAIGGVSTGEHKVIATVNGEDIHEDVYMEWYLETMSLSLGLDMSTELDAQVTSFLDSYKLSYLGSYAEQVALMQEAKKENIEVADKEVEDYIKELVTLYQTDEEGFKAIQTMMGFTDETIRRYIKNQMIIQNLYEAKTEGITEPEQSPEEYYNTYPGEFKIDETRTVRHILIEAQEEEAKAAAKQEAEAIIKSLNEGADFAALVTEKSDDKGSVAGGGVIGPFNSAGVMDGGSSLVAPFTEASYALQKTGDITQEPVESQFGYHIIILDDISPARTKSFDEVKGDLATRLLQDAKDKYFDEYYSEIVDKAEITYVEGYDPMALFSQDAPDASDGGEESTGDGEGAEDTVPQD